MVVRRMDFVGVGGKNWKFSLELVRGSKCPCRRFGFVYQRRQESCSSQARSERKSSLVVSYGPRHHLRLTGPRRYGLPGISQVEKIGNSKGILVCELRKGS